LADIGAVVFAFFGLDELGLELHLKKTANEQ
jgi:hypothetical protein